MNTRGKETPCNCVFRAIFRACFNRFRSSVTQERHMTTVTLEFCSGRQSRRTYSRKTEEFIADFTLLSRRALDDFEYKLFRFHFLLGADWRLCCRQLKIDRGNFFHSVYRIQQKLGRAFAETEPYGLYPIDEYFAPPLHEPVEASVRLDGFGRSLARKPGSMRGKWEVPLSRPA